VITGDTRYPRRIIFLSDRTSAGQDADWRECLSGVYQAAAIITYDSGTASATIDSSTLTRCEMAPPQPRERPDPRFTARGERKKRPWSGR
jgi:hypothetical protein